ncbi:MAG: HIT domain-containing protein [Patescibacteria group bacterium]
MKCAYCELPEIQDRAIARNELAWVFPTNIPIVPGHVLIAPVRCVAKLEDMTTEELAAILEMRLRLKPVLGKLFGAEGFNYAWNEEKIAGQSVPHFHLHMLPRKEGDEGITEYEPRTFLYRPGSREATPERELIDVAEKIKREMA